METSEKTLSEAKNEIVKNIGDIFKSFFSEYDCQRRLIFDQLVSLPSNQIFDAAIACINVTLETASDMGMLQLVGSLTKYKNGEGKQYPNVVKLIDIVIEQWTKYKEFIIKHHLKDHAAFISCSLNPDMMFERVTFSNMFTSDNLYWHRVLAGKHTRSLRLPVFCFYGGVSNGEPTECSESSHSRKIRKFNISRETRASAFKKLEDALRLIIDSQALIVGNIAMFNEIDVYFQGHQALVEICEASKLELGIFHTGGASVTNLHKKTEITVPSQKFSLTSTVIPYRITEAKKDLELSGIVVLCGHVVSKLSKALKSKDSLMISQSNRHYWDGLKNLMDEVADTQKECKQSVTTRYHENIVSLANEETADKAAFNAKYGVTDWVQVSSFIEHVNRELRRIQDSVEEENAEVKKKMKEGERGEKLAKMEAMIKEIDELIKDIPGSLSIGDITRRRLFEEFRSTGEAVAGQLDYINKFIKPHEYSDIYKQCIDECIVAAGNATVSQLEERRVLEKGDYTLDSAMRAVRTYTRASLIARELSRMSNEAWALIKTRKEQAEAFEEQRREEGRREAERERKYEDEKIEKKRVETNEKILGKKRKGSNNKQVATTRPSKPDRTVAKKTKKHDVLPKKPQAVDGDETDEEREE